MRFARTKLSGVDRKKPDCRPGLWLAETFSTSHLKLPKGMQWTLTGIKILKSSTKFVFFGPTGKQDGRPVLLLAETFSTYSLKPLNGIQRNLTESNISISSAKFLFFGTIGKNKMAALASDFFNFSSKTAERNSTKLDRNQDLNVRYLILVFRTDRKICHRGFWLADTIWTSPLKPLKRIQRYLTGRSYQCPLPCLCF